MNSLITTRLILAAAMLGSSCRAQDLTPIKLTANKTTSRVGQDVVITVTLINSTPNPLVLPVSRLLAHAEENYAFDVEFLNKKQVALTEKGQLNTEAKEGSKSLRVLKPGESLSENTVLNRYYNLSQPGVYFVRAVRQNTNHSVGNVQSDLLQITVAP